MTKTLHDLQGKSLHDLQREQAEKLYEFSDLNGFQVEDASGWETVETGEEIEQMWRTVYVSNISEEAASESILSPVTLSVHFKRLSHLISHAYIHGEEVTDLARTNRE